MKPLLLILLIGGMAPGPTPPPGIPLPGPPPIVEPVGPSPTLGGPSSLKAVETLREPSGRAVRTARGAAPPSVAPSAPAPGATPTAVEAPVKKGRRSWPWIGLGAVVVVAGTVAWFVVRRRRHA